jgi:hypothetical protein
MPSILIQDIGGWMAISRNGFFPIAHVQKKDKTSGKHLKVES